MTKGSNSRSPEHFPAEVVPRFGVDAEHRCAMAKMRRNRMLVRRSHSVGMVRALALAALAAGVYVCAAAGPASAGMACRETFTASGKAANPQNYDPPRHYNAEKLARDRAIAAWRARISLACPQVSNLWWRARERKVVCEGYAGGIGCEASGTPAARRLGL